MIENVIVEKAERAPKKESEVLDWLKIHAEEYGFCEVEDIFNEESYDDSNLKECATPSEVFLNQKVTSEDVVVLPTEPNFIDFQTSGSTVQTSSFPCSTDFLVLPSISDVVPTAQCSEDLSPLTNSTSNIAPAEQNSRVSTPLASLDTSNLDLIPAEQNSSVSTPLANIDSSNFDPIPAEQNSSLCTPLAHLDTSKLDLVLAEQNSDDSIPLANLETSSLIISAEQSSVEYFSINQKSSSVHCI